MEKHSVSAQRFREILGEWPSGVVVITSMVDGVPTGMAMNSFTSVSLDPPLVGFFPAKTSSTWPVLRQPQRFCINVLASHHEDMSRLFARKGVDRFASIGWHPRASGPGIDDAVAWIDCELHDELDAGDHTFVLGLVVHVDARDDADPLVFHRGQYTALQAAPLVQASL
jgi:3-hydroxy-9,10-secoandrosta-1,3,5(10)-triene-9,17-dione monooxygenase reductase component